MTPKALLIDKVQLTDEIEGRISELNGQQQAELATLIWKISGDFEQMQAVKTFLARVICKRFKKAGMIIPKDLYAIAVKGMPGDKKK